MRRDHQHQPSSTARTAVTIAVLSLLVTTLLSKHSAENGGPIVEAFGTYPRSLLSNHYHPAAIRTSVSRTALHPRSSWLHVQNRIRRSYLSSSSSSEEDDNNESISEEEEELKRRRKREKIKDFFGPTAKAAAAAKAAAEKSPIVEPIPLTDAQEEF
eukprot:4867218-Ditylum_brightwellii.AAC.1